jgi:hypothetical protein
MSMEPGMVVTGRTRVRIDEVLPDQRVLVAGCVDGVYVGVVVCEVGRVYGSREGWALIAGRIRRVYQRYPFSYVPDFEWTIDADDCEGIEPFRSDVAKV